MGNIRELNEHRKNNEKNVSSFFYSMIEMIGNIIVYFVCLFTRDRMYVRTLYIHRTVYDLLSMAK